MGHWRVVGWTLEVRLIYGSAPVGEVQAYLLYQSEPRSKRPCRGVRKVLRQGLGHQLCWGKLEIQQDNIAISSDTYIKM